MLMDFYHLKRTVIQVGETVNMEILSLRTLRTVSMTETSST